MKNYRFIECPDGIPRCHDHEVAVVDVESGEQFVAQTLPARCWESPFTDGIEALPGANAMCLLKDVGDWRIVMAECP